MLGKPVPDLSLASTGGTTFRLSSARGKKLALYLYPPERHQDFRRTGCEVFAVSRDAVKWQKLQEQNRYGKKVRGITNVEEVLNFVKAL